MNCNVEHWHCDHPVHTMTNRQELTDESDNEDLKMIKWRVMIEIDKQIWSIMPTPLR